MSLRNIRAFHAPRVTIVVIAATTIALVIVSPLALQAIASIFNLNWIRLGDIGQAYGAVSALIAALALSGVAISIFLQAREARHSRWAAGRDRHFELMRIAMDNPFYRQVFVLPDMADDMARLTGYINMVLHYWSMLWEFGDVSERDLRANLKGILHSKVGRAYWVMNRGARLAGGGTRREMIFNRIADSVYHEVINSGTARIDVGRSPSKQWGRLRETIIAIAIGLTFGAISYCALRIKRTT
jgi:hypothetical protein